MSNSLIKNVSIRNILVNKLKNSDFLDYIQDSDNLFGASIIRILHSGNYYIYTLSVPEKDYKKLKAKIEEIQEQWI